MYYFIAADRTFLAAALAPNGTPPGAVEVNDEEHETLFAGQDQGMVIVAGPDGRPALQAPPPPPPAPLAPLTARQLRLWLLSQGITRAMVEAKLSELPALEQEAAEIEWEYSTQYLRDHPLIGQIGAAFGLSAGDIDAAWPEAAAL